MTRYRAHIVNDPLIQANSLILLRRSEEAGVSDVALAITDLAFCKPGELIPRACHPKDTDDIVQAIINAAWDAGMRPDGYKDEASSITRIEDHLADMRRLVFKIPNGEKV